MKQAMIFAAGLGTRLKPITDTMPKALVSVGGRPLIDWTILRLQQQGYQHFVVNVHHFAQQIVNHIHQQYLHTPEVLISHEEELLLETGGGLKKAAPLFDANENILIHNVDIIDNVDYNWFSRQHLPDEDAVLLVSRRKTKRYLLFDPGMRLMGWVNIETGEVKSPFSWLREATITVDNDLQVTVSSYHSPHSTSLTPLYAFAFSGIQSFSPRLFKLMEQFPDRFSIMDFYLQTCHRRKITGCLKEDLFVLDVGKIDSLDTAAEYLKKQEQPQRTQDELNIL